MLDWILTDTMGSPGAFERRQDELAIIKKGTLEHGSNPYDNYNKITAAKERNEITHDEVYQSYVDEVNPTL